MQDAEPWGKRFVDPPGWRAGASDVSPRKDAALRVLEWELKGHGGEVLQAMLEHPGMSLSDAVDLIERENPAWSETPPEAPVRRGLEVDDPPEPSRRRGRAGPELASLHQEFMTFRHLLKPHEAKAVEEAFRELDARPDSGGIAALRQRVRTLALQAAFWRELAGPAKTSNALGVVLLRPDGRLIAHGGATEALQDATVSHAMAGEVERRGAGVYVMQLPVGRLVIARGKTVALATLFRHAPGKEVVDVLERTVAAIDENGKAAEKTFSDSVLAARYADAFLKLVQRIAG